MKDVKESAKEESRDSVDILEEILYSVRGMDRRISYLEGDSRKRHSEWSSRDKQIVATLIDKLSKDDLYQLISSTGLSAIKNYENDKYIDNEKDITMIRNINKKN